MKLQLPTGTELGNKVSYCVPLKIWCLTSIKRGLAWREIFFYPRNRQFIEFLRCTIRQNGSIFVSLFLLYHRGYKESNRNILSLVFVSESEWFKKVFGFLSTRYRILDFCICFKRNRIHDFNRIIRLIQISGFFNRKFTELFGWTE